MIRTVTLGSGRSVTLGAYVRAWRRVIAADPDTPVSEDLRGWGRSTAGVARRQFLQGMHERISEAVPYRERGTPGATAKARQFRKLDPDWQRAARLCAREVNTPRRIVRYVPREFRERLAHRIWADE